MPPYNQMPPINDTDIVKIAQRGSGIGAAVGVGATGVGTGVAVRITAGTTGSALVGGFLLGGLTFGAGMGVGN